MSCRLRGGGCSTSKVTPAPWWETQDLDTIDPLLHADAKAVATEAAKPLGVSPNGYDSAWKSRSGTELEPLLAHTTLVDAGWLLKLAQGEAMPERKGVVPPWQLLPPEAKVSLKELRQTDYIMPLAVLSYGWAAKGHPDPTGAQLRSLVPVLRSMLTFCDGRVLKWGIVWDFMSLPQRGYTAGYDPERDDRTPYQLARFGAGLKNINVWYGHPTVYTLVLDLPMPKGSENMSPVDKRGWCAALSLALCGLCVLPSAAALCPLLPSPRAHSCPLCLACVSGASLSAASAASPRTRNAASRSAASRRSRRMGRCMAGLRSSGSAWAPASRPSRRPRSRR